MINKIYSMFGLCMKAGKLAYGSDMCEEKISHSLANLVIVSEDSSNNTKEKFEKICEKYNVTYIVFGNVELISHSIGKNNKTVIAILDKGFAERIEEMVNEIKGDNN